MVVGELGVAIRSPRAVVSGEVRGLLGGKGANQACAAGRLGGQVHMVGRVGGDEFLFVLPATGLDSAIAWPTFAVPGVARNR